MEFNWLAVIVSTLIPMIVGFIWYNEKVVGKAWMKASDMTEEKINSGNMAMIFGVSLVMSFLMTIFLHTIVIHQMHVASTLMGEPGFEDPNSEIGAYFADFMSRFGDNFRTFKHGALHGFITSLFFVFPILTINSLFERRGWKYILIHAGYWAITLTLMGGVICGWV